MRCFSLSSRRRHTRWPRDWSSDVCSSDLKRVHNLTYHNLASKIYYRKSKNKRDWTTLYHTEKKERLKELKALYKEQIGRASCRETGKIAGRDRTGKARRI